MDVLDNIDPKHILDEIDEIDVKNIFMYLIWERCFIPIF